MEQASVEIWGLMREKRRERQRERGMWWCSIDPRIPYAGVLKCLLVTTGGEMVMFGAILACPFGRTKRP